MTPPRQLALPFVHVESYGLDFLAADSNAEALTWLERTHDWPERRLALWGGNGAGKTHLLHLWARRHAAEVVGGPILAAQPVRHALAIDDADAAPEQAMLHTLNAALEAAHPVLLAVREPPARWGAALPDLVSRLRAVVAVGIGAPEDSLLRALLAKLLAERGLSVPEGVQHYLLLHLPRTAGAVREATARLDRLGGRPTRSLAREVLRQMGAVSTSGSHEDLLTVSPEPGRLL